MDDVIIVSGDPIISYDELLAADERDITRVLDLLIWHKLMGSSDKGTIAVSEMVFTGHVVSNRQWKPVPGKVAAIYPLAEVREGVRTAGILTHCRGGAWPRDAAADTQASKQAKHCAFRGILIEQSVPGSLPLRNKTEVCTKKTSGYVHRWVKS